MVGDKTSNIYFEIMGSKDKMARWGVVFKLLNKKLQEKIPSRGDMVVWQAQE